jgi:hypothetical protein
MQHKRYDNTAYRMARAASGKLHPEPGLVDTVSWIMRFMLRERIISPMPGPEAANKATSEAMEPVPAGAFFRNEGIHDQIS